MNQYYFNRIYSLTIGFPLQQQKAKMISGLRLTFDITKSELPGGNSCTITINNLSDDTRAFIKERPNQDGQGMTIILKAGYEEMEGRDNLSTLFVGDIMTSTHDITKPEVVTTLTCWDAGISIRKSRFDKQYNAGTRVSQIINDIVDSLGVSIQSPFSFVSIDRPDYVYARGYTFNGLASDALNRVCNGYGLRWHIQNNVMKIYSAFDKNGKPGTATKSTFSAVLIGSPRRIAKMQQGIESIDYGGYEFDCLLAPKVEPGNIVELSSKTIPNSPVKLQISEVHHAGDTHGADWKTTVKGRKL
jgi:hypothetical protein